MPQQQPPERLRQAPCSGRCARRGGRRARGEVLETTLLLLLLRLLLLLLLLLAPGEEPRARPPHARGSGPGPEPVDPGDAGLWGLFFESAGGELGVFSFLLFFLLYFFRPPSLFFPSFPPSSFPLLSGAVILKPGRRLQGGTGRVRKSCRNLYF